MIDDTTQSRSTELTADDADASQMVTIGRYNDAAEAQMARSAVEAAGFACFLQGENANSLIPTAFRARLMVSAADEQAACAVLTNSEVRPFTENEVLAAEQADEAERGLTGTGNTTLRS